MADDYDFQINDLRFREATSDKMPYSRSTAPFRKDQFDSAPTVGDQSLTGWWTRGQLSFHKGAGLKYYEVLDGEAVINRFLSSRGVNVSKAGQVSLARRLVNATSTALVDPDGAVVMQWAQNSYTDRSGVYYLDEGLKFVPYPIGPTVAAVPITTVSSVGIFAENITSDGRRGIWLVTNSGVEATVGGIGPTKVVYTHTQQLTGIGFAKERLWVVNSDGDLFAVAPATSGTATALASPVCRLEGTRGFRVTESPGDVYLSVQTNRVYRVTLSGDGSVPTLSAPIVAGELPQGELVTAMRYYLGNLILATSSGIRVAIVQGDGGLLFGPLLKELDYDSFGCTIAVRGTSAYLVQQTTPGTFGGASVYEINLAEPVGDVPGNYAWCEYDQYEAVRSDYAGCVDIYNGFLLFGNDTLKFTSSSELMPSGYVTTGYHRFGTLDPKAFQTVSVRCGGTGGSISVARVDADGTTTTLGTITPAESAKDFNLGLTAPVERIALKFTLTRDLADPGKGPELLGYQLKALPVPKRQRIFRWPLLIQDNIRLRRGNAVGKEGRAYSDIKALEALESSAAVVTFTDHRTGETGSAYIDSVEYQGVTASSPTSNGFGGLAYVTLRVIS